MQQAARVILDFKPVFFPLLAKYGKHVHPDDQIGYIKAFSTLAVNNRRFLAAADNAMRPPAKFLQALIIPVINAAVSIAASVTDALATGIISAKGREAALELAKQDAATRIGVAAWGVMTAQQQADAIKVQAALALEQQNSQGNLINQLLIGGIALTAVGITGFIAYQIIKG